MSLSKLIVGIVGLLLLSAAITGFGLSIHNITKVKSLRDNVEKIHQTVLALHEKIHEGEVPPPETPPTSPPDSVYLPEPFVTKKAGHVQQTSNRVSYEIEGYTDKVAFQGFITVRVPASYIPSAYDDNTFRVRLDTQMWVAEDGVEFVRVPGPIYHVVSAVWIETNQHTGEERDLFAKVEFSKPLSFSRPVQNLSVGVDLIEASLHEDDFPGLTDDDRNIRHPQGSPNSPIADMMLDVQW